MALTLKMKQKQKEQNATDEELSKSPLSQRRSAAPGCALGPLVCLATPAY